jgi:hypothetical protein
MASGDPEDFGASSKRFQIHVKVINGLGSQCRVKYDITLGA